MSMSTIETTPADTPHKVVMGNGDAVISKESDNHEQTNGSILHFEENKTKERGSVPMESTPDLTRKSSPPLVLVENEEGVKDGDGDGEEEREEEVKIKSSKGHTRGSSVSSGVGSHGQCETATTTTNSSTSSLSASFYSNDCQLGETTSLPNTQLLRTDAVRTGSDSMLAALKSAGDLTEEEKKETISRLLEEIVALKMDILKLKEENSKLKKVRTEMDDELHTLTENLFEEAYKMVDEAKGEKFHVEKRLADATGQIEAMETQVSTLHQLLKSTPKSSPSLHKHKRPSVKKFVKKISRRGHSSKHKGATPLLEHKVDVKGSILKEGELSTDEFSVFDEWLKQGLPTTPGCHPFFDLIHSLQILPCLDFKNKELARRVQRAIENNTLIIEPLNHTSLDEVVMKKPCALSEETSFPCSYLMKLEDDTKCHYISSNCRDRVVSVCDFYTFVGYIQKGIIRKEATEVYWQIARCRAVMNLACLCLSLPDS